jgi:phosphatidylglycerophosphate synthase
MVGIVLMLAFGIPQGLAWLNNTVLILVVITTVWSGTEYFIRNRDVLKGSESGSVLS